MAGARAITGEVQIEGHVVQSVAPCGDEVVDISGAGGSSPWRDIMSAARVDVARAQPSDALLRRQRLAQTLITAIRSGPDANEEVASARAHSWASGEFKYRTS